MNANYLEGESHSTHVERLEREMTEEVVEHKKAIAQALLGNGHKVKLPDDLTQEYTAENWTIDGDDINIRCVFARKGFYPREPTGTLRFEVGPYGDRTRFLQRTSGASLKKFPKGFDYNAIAEEMVSLIRAEKARVARAQEASRLTRMNNAKAIGAAQRLMHEFGLKPHGDYFGCMAKPISFDQGHEYLKLNFTNLTEDQAIVIMQAARDCGAMPATDTE
jgi:hypothetical protein